MSLNSKSCPVTEKESDFIKESDSIITDVINGEIDTINSNARYFGYVGRFKNLLIATSRYLAYISDAGEAFRPIAHPHSVRAAYGISWLYIIGDVTYEGYKVKYINKENSEHVGRAMIKRSVFQGIASMGLPAFTIHSIVKYSGRYVFQNAKNRRIRVWGPVVAGLSIMPALPFLFDHPVEVAVDSFFGKFYPESKFPEKK
ncbi:hypothetical protein T552_03151 [Pneumocystis carinii B80]|uniref:Mitochondrial fission process protein 1 n=1 Tax=Pneumocystis carinii (strain B80) TaxID=1408658 RepID=A0A0W4ZC16_PNEC8|nr:hypothetical protein T552_03151 [Pneumocystis carinii B80]KTW25877.1 hypothetical protein T552_03151 [Pneumocystis carinii B80]